MVCSNQFCSAIVMDTVPHWTEIVFFPISVLCGLQLISFLMCITVVLLYIRQVIEIDGMIMQPAMHTDCQAVRTRGQWWFSGQNFVLVIERLLIQIPGFPETTVGLLSKDYNFYLHQIYAWVVPYLKCKSLRTKTFARWFKEKQVVRRGLDRSLISNANDLSYFISHQWRLTVYYFYA